MKGKILAVIIGIIGALSFVRGVRADEPSNLEFHYMNNLYAYHYKSGVLVSYGKLPYRYQNGLMSYCIQPNRGINVTTYYSTSDWSRSGFDENVKKQMELIAHYGYGYKNHNTDKYYMATQELIWLYTDDQIRFMDAYSSDGTIGNQINTEEEKNEIMRLVNRHSTLPSFDGSCFNKYFGEKLVLEDINNVLEDYEITSELPISRNGNTLEIDASKFGNFEIKLTKKSSNNNQTLVYYGPNDTQTMASFGGYSPIESKFNVIVDKAKIRINKRDKNTRSLIVNNTGKFRIDGTNFKEYVELDNEGYGYYDLHDGSYVITEINAPNGYIRNKEKITITIDNNISLNDGYYDIDIYNDVPRAQIQIVKEGDDGEALYGVEFGLFDSNHKLLSKLVTNEGVNSFTDLPLGKYYVRELRTLEGYVLDGTEYEFNMNYINDRSPIVKQTLKIRNKKIRCDVVYVSTDAKNKKIKGVEINVYDSNNELVFTGKTDKNGKVTITNLPYGKYYIKQVKVPSGYVLNEEEYTFYVNDSTCIGKINVHNDATIMPVTSKSFNISLILFLISLTGAFIYVKKAN